MVGIGQRCVGGKHKDGVTPEFFPSVADEGIDPYIAGEDGTDSQEQQRNSHGFGRFMDMGHDSLVGPG